MLTGTCYVGVSCLSSIGFAACIAVVYHLVIGAILFLWNHKVLLSEMGAIHLRSFRVGKTLFYYSHYRTWRWGSWNRTTVVHRCLLWLTPNPKEGWENSSQFSAYAQSPVYFVYQNTISKSGCQIGFSLLLIIQTFWTDSECLHWFCALET